MRAIMSDPRRVVEKQLIHEPSSGDMREVEVVEELGQRVAAELCGDRYLLCGAFADGIYHSAIAFGCACTNRS